MIYDEHGGQTCLVQFLQKARGRPLNKQKKRARYETLMCGYHIHGAIFEGNQQYLKQYKG